MELTLDRRLPAPTAVVFDILADLEAYREWLPIGAMYRGTTLLGDGPIAAGRRYEDRSARGTLVGQIVTFDPPRRLAFSQGARLLGIGVTIEVTYDLTEVEGQTELRRTWRMILPWWLRPLGRRMLPDLARENERILDALGTKLQEPWRTSPAPLPRSRKPEPEPVGDQVEGVEGGSEGEVEPQRRIGSDPPQPLDQLGDQGQDADPDQATTGVAEADGGEAGDEEGHDEHVANVPPDRP